MSWNLADGKSVKSCVAYLTKNEISPRTPDLATVRIAPKICLSKQTMYSRVLQIASESVHFQRSHIRTGEHRQSALKSESNIRLKPVLRAIAITKSVTRARFKLRQHCLIIGVRLVELGRILYEHLAVFQRSGLVGRSHHTATFRRVDFNASPLQQFAEFAAVNCQQKRTQERFCGQRHSAVRQQFVGETTVQLQAQQ